MTESEIFRSKEASVWNPTEELRNNSISTLSSSTKNKRKEAYLDWPVLPVSPLNVGFATVCVNVEVSPFESVVRTV